MRPQGKRRLLCSKTVPFFSKTPPFRAVIRRHSRICQELNPPTSVPAPRGRGKASAAKAQEAAVALTAVAALAGVPQCAKL